MDKNNPEKYNKKETQAVSEIIKLQERRLNYQSGNAWEVLELTKEWIVHETSTKKRIINFKENWRLQSYNQINQLEIPKI